MDLTLADYIKRTMELLEKEKTPAVPAEYTQYLVYPERRGEESDEKINPFSQV